MEKRVFLQLLPEAKIKVGPVIKRWIDVTRQPTWGKEKENYPLTQHAVAIYKSQQGRGKKEEETVLNIFLSSLLLSCSCPLRHLRRDTQVSYGGEKWLANEWFRTTSLRFFSPSLVQKREKQHQQLSPLQAFSLLVQYDDANAKFLRLKSSCCRVDDWQSNKEGLNSPLNARGKAQRISHDLQLVKH